MGIPAAAAFTVGSMYHREKVKIPGQLFSDRDMILPINHIADWRYIRQRKHAQTNKDVNSKNTTRRDHDYRVGDKVTTNNRSAYKYETPLRGPYKIVRTWKNWTVTLRTGVVTHRTNIHNIKPYNDADIE